MYKKIENIYIASNSSNKSNKIYPIIFDKLKQSGFNILSEYDYSCDLVVSVGGDGSFLKNVHDLSYPDCYFMGINTGHLGFFQAVMPDKINEMIESIKTHNFTVQNVIPLEATITTKLRETKIFAINEFVIKSSKNKTVHLDICIGGKHIEKFSGDGIIVSSTVGSTAYNYSASGSIIDPSLTLLQITPISPLNSNAYRSLTSSIILPYSSTVNISPENRYQNSTLVLSDSTDNSYDTLKSIEIIYSNNKIKLLNLQGYEFWKKVKEKFL